jgi:hypothetical protein
MDDIYTLAELEDIEKHFYTRSIIPRKLIRSALHYARTAKPPTEEDHREETGA